MFHNLAVYECLSFLNDIPRNTWYNQSIADAVKDKVVLEIGCGAGILAAYCLQHGAKHYIGVDVKKHRADYTRELLTELGYGNKITLYYKDFLNLEPKDLPHNVDVLLCEQTSDQMLVNFNMCDFWNHANNILGDYVSLPDSWNLDVLVYEGIISTELAEHAPKTLIDHPSLPNGYANAVANLNQVKPDKIIKNALQIGPTTVNNPIEFTLDLSEYKNATLVLSDSISYKDSRCISISASIDWSAIPTALHVTDCKKQTKIVWDPTLSVGAFRNGSWRV